MCMPTISQEIFTEGLIQLLNLDREWVPNAHGASLYVRPFMFAMDNYIGVKPSETSIEGGTGWAKTAGNYAASLYPALQAQKNGYDQLLWTDGKSHSKIEESGTMNVMFKIKGTIITAPINTGTILKGITRDSVIQLAKDWKEPLEERFLTVSELEDALENAL
ncbi:putative branched-chain-amino-acid aminotransferase 2-like [Daphnia sinensis]|uniref:Branched-chain-amino-acid aminotransferase 2-like n=1 Tax=Daphnia sinensis TaxID=1820382 RepID=A0AAD5KEM3_9CRUS|nr:putative branched-chain-amino-acid aminotransferase 2-like [Daphnia sinensis]